MAAPILETVRPGVQFILPAAASFLRLEAARGRRIDVNSTYRDWALQLRWHNESLAYLAGKIPYPGHSYAVHPDYSDHTMGVGLDSDDWTDPDFVKLAAEHGWIRTAASDPTERHHFKYIASRDEHSFDQPTRPATSTPPIVIIPDQLENTDMSKIIYARGTNNSSVFAIDTQTGCRRPVPANEYAVANAEGLPNYGATKTGELVFIPQASMDSIPFYLPALVTVGAGRYLSGDGLTVPKA